MAKRQPRPKPRFAAIRRLTVEETAHYLGWSVSTFHKRRDDLKAVGFPEPDPLLERYDLDAIDAWLDARSGLAEELSDGGLMDRIRGLEDEKAA